MSGNRVRAIGWGGAAALLLLPLAAMQVTREVQWTGLDFAAMAVMLAVAGGLVELGARLSGSMAYRAGFAVAVLTGFLLVWVNLAVGFFGDEGNPANLAFAGLLAAAVLGAIAVRGRPGGMAAVIAGLACLQALIGVGGLAAGYAEASLGSAIFVGLWLVSAWLFSRTS